MNVQQLQEENSRLTRKNRELREEVERLVFREKRARKLLRRKLGFGVWVTKTYMGAELRSSSARLIEQARRGTVSSDAIASVVAACVRRVIRVGVLTFVVAGVSGLVGSALVVWQNLEIRSQTYDAVSRRAGELVERTVSTLTEIHGIEAEFSHVVARPVNARMILADRPPQSREIEEAVIRSVLEGRERGVTRESALSGDDVAHLWRSLKLISDLAKELDKAGYFGRIPRRGSTSAF